MSDIEVTIDENTAYIIEVPGVSAASVLTTKGDLLGHSTITERIPVGTDGYVLTADSTEDNGVKWSEASGGSGSKIEDGNSSVEVVDTAAGVITMTTDNQDLMTLRTTDQPVTISHPASYLGTNIPLVLMETEGSSSGKGSVLHLKTNRSSSPVDINVFKISNSTDTLFSILNDGKTAHRGSLYPTSDDTSDLGLSTNTYSNIHLKDENGTYVTVRELAKLHRDYSECAAITPYTISSSVSGGVWTITLEAVGEPDIAFTFNNIVYRTSGSSISVNATSYAGTDANPNTVYVYVKPVGSSPTLVASNTNPEGVESYYAPTARYIAGAVSSSSINIYTKIEDVVEMAGIANKVYNRTFIDGPKYIDGMDVTATQSDLTIGSGNYKLIFENIATVSKSVGTDGLFFIDSDGNYNTKTDFSFTEYSTGESIGSNKFYNVVLGVCQDDTTRIHALVQKGDPLVEYDTVRDAFIDDYGATVSKPTDELLRNTFIPVARVIIKNDANDYLQSGPNGLYYIDIRNTGSVCGGGGESSPLTTKGDIYVYSTENDRLPLGSNGEVLTVDDSESTGVKWTTVSGGSGFTDPMTTRGDVIVRDASNETNRLSLGTDGQVLSSDGTDIVWSTISGSGFSDPTTTRGDIIYKNSAGTTTRLPAGSADQVLTSDGTDISWTTISGGSTSSGISDIVDDTSPQLGGDLDLNGNNINYGSIITADDTYTGDIISVTVDDASTVFGDVLCQGSDFHFDRADADATTTSPAFVIATESGSGSKTAMVRGQICDTGWDWNAGKLYLSGTIGKMTQTVPTTSGQQIQVLGWALSADTVWFDPMTIVAEVD